MAGKINYKTNGVEYYRVRATIGKKADGTPILKSFLGKSKKEAEQKRDEYLHQLRLGLNVDFDKATLGELMHTWLYDFKRVSENIKPATFSRYEGVYRKYIQPYPIANIKISELKTVVIQRFYNDLFEEGKTSASIRTLNSLLSNFITFAIEQDYLIKNPLKGTTIPSNPGELTKDRKLDVYTDDEIKQLKKAIKGYIHENLILVALGTGLRQGELLGLQWKHIDFDKKTITVNQTLKTYSDIKSDGTRSLVTALQTPKSKHSIRVVPIPESLVVVLNKQKISTMEMAISLGKPFNDDVLVFTNSQLSYIDARALLRSYKRMLARNDIRERDFHSLRHTYATQLIRRGVSIEVIAELLGHSSTEITKIYAHILDDDKQKAVDKLNDIFSVVF